jgi:hypothetical protein
MRRHPSGVLLEREKSRSLQRKPTRFEHGYRLILGYKRASDNASAKGCWAENT